MLEEIKKIIKSLRLIDIKNFFNNCFKYSSDNHSKKTYIGNIGKLEINNIVNGITPNQFEEIKKTTETLEGELSKITGLLESSQDYRETLAKNVVSGTILINLPKLQQGASTGFIKMNPNTNYTLFLKCGKCSKFFNSGIRGNLQSLINTTLSNNLHQCQHCGNKQLAKDNLDYFFFPEENNP